MSKVLYPKSQAPRERRSSAQEDMLDRPYHVYYTDPDNPTATPQWKHYNSELAVKVDAWYQCRVLGFNTAATLYSREELRSSFASVEPQNVRDYGAVGDNSTDDTAALQAAIDSAASSEILQGPYDVNIDSSTGTHYKHQA